MGAAACFRRVFHCHFMTPRDVIELLNLDSRFVVVYTPGSERSGGSDSIATVLIGLSAMNDGYFWAGSFSSLNKERAFLFEFKDPNDALNFKKQVLSRCPDADVVTRPFCGLAPTTFREKQVQSIVVRKSG